MKIWPWILAGVATVGAGFALRYFLPQQPIIVNLPPGVSAKDFAGHISLEPANYSSIIGTIPAILSSITAIVAVIFTFRQLKFSHEERKSTLRGGLNSKRIDLFTSTYAVGSTLLGKFHLLVHGSDDMKSPSMKEVSDDIYRYGVMLSEGLAQLEIVASDKAVKAGLEFRRDCLNFILESRYLPTNRLTMKGLLTVAQSSYLEWNSAARNELGTEQLSQDIRKLLGKDLETQEAQRDRN